MLAAKVMIAMKASRVKYVKFLVNMSKHETRTSLGTMETINCAFRNVTFQKVLEKGML